jgi:hypothetical protein
MGLRDDSEESRVASGDPRLRCPRATAIKIMIEVRDSLDLLPAHEEPTIRGTINAAIGKLDALIEFYR